jgi:hypothetical protein
MAQSRVAHLAERHRRAGFLALPSRPSLNQEGSAADFFPVWSNRNPIAALVADDARGK